MCYNHLQGVDKMSKVSTSERLKELLSLRKLKQIDVLEKAKPFCEKYNVKLEKNDLSQYVSGKVEPGQRKLFILALTFNVSEAWLMGFDVPMERTFNQDISSIDNIIPMPKMKKVPLLGDIACGVPIFAEEQYGEYIESDVVADFCLRAAGDSMIGARILDGDIVFIKKQEMVQNGEIAAVLIDNEATLKRVYYYPDKAKIVLSPENAQYEPFVYVGEELNEIKILGKAVAFQSNVR